MNAVLGAGRSADAVRPALARWSVLLPPGTVELVLPLSRSARRVRQATALLPSGTTVVLVDGRPGSRVRMRRAASAAGVVIETEYLVLPTLSSATIIVQDSEATVRWLWDSVATVPPGVARGAALVDALVRLGRSVLPTRALGWVVPGRLTVGRCP